MKAKPTLEQALYVEGLPEGFFQHCFFKRMAKILILFLIPVLFPVPVFIKIRQEDLPHFQSVLGCQIHAVSLFGVVCPVEFLKLDHDRVGA